MKLVATPTGGSTLGTVSGTGSASACTTSPCTFTLAANSTASVEFVPPVGAVKLECSTTTGTGTGQIQVTGGTCNSFITAGEVVTLEAVPTGGHSLFTGWSVTGSGSVTTPCIGTTNPCEVKLESPGPVSAVATFSLELHLLTVTREGAGTGSVESTSPVAPKINCGTECSKEFEHGTLVKLKGISGPNTLPVTWEGCGTVNGSNECEVTMTEAKNVKAKFSLEKHLLTVTKEGTGTGTVESTSPVSPKINCGTECSKEYDHGTLVILKGTPGPNTLPVTWEGCGTVNGSNECEVTMTAAKNVKAKFSLEKHLLTVTKNGTGTGTVASTPAGINCGTECSAEFDHGTLVKLKGTPGANSVAPSWTGCDAVNGSNECEVTISAAKGVTATFSLEKHLLTVTKNGTGSGIIESTPPGINCGATCTAEYEHGTLVKLKGTPAAHSGPVAWTGCDAVNGSNECEVTMSAVKSVTGTFTRITHTLTVTIKGTGVGSVSCKLEGDAAFGSCARAINEGSKVEVKATAAKGSAFEDFSAGTGSAVGCTTSICTINEFEVNSALTATFNKETATFEVTLAGNGSGVVTCKVGTGSFGSCVGPFNKGDVITVQGTAGQHSTFNGFSAGTGSAKACKEAKPCTFTLEEPSTLTATFTKITHTLSVSTAGSGTGTVTCNGGACASSYDEGTVLALAAAPGAGSTFGGWGGSCTGTAGCTITLEANVSVSATFTKEEAKAGTPVPPRSVSYKGGKASFPIKCNGAGPCKGSFQLKAKVKQGKKTKTVVIGKGSFNIDAGKSKTIKVSITNGSAKGQLNSGKSLKATYSGGLKGSVTIKPPKKK